MKNRKSNKLLRKISRLQLVITEQNRQFPNRDEYINTVNKELEDIKRQFNSDQQRVDSIYMYISGQYNSAIKKFVELNHKISLLKNDKNNVHYIPALLNCLACKGTYQRCSFDCSEIAIEELYNDILKFVYTRVPQINRALNIAHKKDMVFEDFIFLPKNGDKYDVQVHDDISIYDFDFVDKVYSLGYNFPDAISRKAMVTTCSKTTK